MWHHGQQFQSPGCHGCATEICSLHVGDIPKSQWQGSCQARIVSRTKPALSVGNMAQGRRSKSLTFLVVSVHPFTGHGLRKSRLRVTVIAFKDANRAIGQQIPQDGCSWNIVGRCCWAGVSDVRLDRTAAKSGVAVCEDQRWCDKKTNEDDRCQVPPQNGFVTLFDATGCFGVHSRHIVMITPAKLACAKPRLLLSSTTPARAISNSSS